MSADKHLSFLKRTSLISTFATGFTALVYEVLWHKYLANLLGSQASATALILAVFLGGLATGYYLFGFISKNKSSRNLIKLCGAVEMLIGIYAIFFQSYYNIFWDNLGIIGGGNILKDLAVSVLLMGLPTILMGGTLPLLTPGLSGSYQDTSKIHASIYSANTAGAFVGALCGGFFLLPNLGLPISMLIMGFVNLLAGAVLILISNKAGNQIPAENHTTAISECNLSITKASFLALLCGFCAITLQSLIIRICGISFGSSEYAFCLVVAAYILLLSLGSSLLALKSKMPEVFNNFCLIQLGLLICYLLIPELPYLAHTLRIQFAWDTKAFYLFQGAVFLVLLILLFVCVANLGRSLPLIFARTNSSHAESGKTVGLIYFFNSLGCVLGAIFGGYLALKYFNIDQIFKALLVIIFIAAFINSNLKKKRVLISLILLLPVFLPLWPKERLAQGTFRQQEKLPFSYAGSNEFYKNFLAGVSLLDYQDDPDTTAAVLKFNPADAPEYLSLLVNGKSDGGTATIDLKTTKLLAHLPAIFSTAQSDRAAVIGFGTGITVGSLSLYEKFKSIDCIEISAAVKNFAHHFENFNFSAHTSHKVNWILDDAYRALGSSASKYSVIISEPSNPWIAGIEKLYTKDFYKIVKGKLDQGGIYAQWFHSYSVSPQTLQLILRTFRSEFKEVRVFDNYTDLIILGSEKNLTLDNIRQANSFFNNDKIKADLNSIAINGLPALLAHESWINVNNLAEGRLQELNFPVLSYWAGKDFFQNRSAILDKLYKHPYYHSLFNDGARHTLLKLLFKQRPEYRNDFAMDISKGLCGQDPDKLGNHWENSHYICKAADFYLYSQGLLAAKSSELAGDFPNLANLKEKYLRYYNSPYF